MPPTTARSRRGLRRRLLTAACAGVVLASCIGTNPSGQEIKGSGARLQPDAERASVGAANVNHLGATLLGTARRGRPNVVISPYAIGLALAMARVGATDDTRRQLDELLGVRGGQELEGDLNALEREIEQRSGEKRSDLRKGRTELQVAAALWGQRGTRFTDAYLSALQADFGRGVRVVDFRSDPEAARGAVNNWARDQTGGSIDQLVPRGEVSQYTRFLATSTSFLRAPWQIPVDPARTRRSRFTLEDGSSTEVPTMQVAAREGLRYGSSTDWEAVELPYLGDELGLVVVVPTSGSFERVVSSLDGATLEQVERSLDSGPVDVRLPIFSFTSALDLQEPVSAAGAPALFSEADADLSGVTSDDALAVSAFPSQWYFGINEEGTEAPPGGAAVTPTTGDAGATARRVVVDRPFLFFVRDRATGAVLLLGQVSRPL